ncbi:MAG: ATP-binding protein [Chloroflexi bacterium]|nr:ATP-binding protein [Chloroflexota bacterium]
MGEEANLFRRFVRLATADTEQYGVGLGLYVVKTAIEAHGGRVGVENRPSGGAVFWFELPLATAEEQRGVGAEEKLTTTNH